MGRSRRHTPFVSFICAACALCLSAASVGDLRGPQRRGSIAAAGPYHPPMNWRLLSRLLGSLALLVGASMLLSLPWAFPWAGQVNATETDGIAGLAGSILLSLLIGGVLYWYGRGSSGPVLRKEALAVVGLGWMLAGFLGAMPYLLSGALAETDRAMTLADCLFESVSGFSTTGASVLTELEDPAYVPRCVMFWRSFTHWLGGMGIVVLFVALLGSAGSGGKAIMRHEVPGPINSAARPRVKDTALLMWSIYVGLSGLLVVLYWFQGLSWYDALCHSFGTMATGGFSTFNDSMGHFGGPRADFNVVEATTIAFMFLAGTNFTLFYLVVRQVQDRRTEPQAWLVPLLKDSEWRAYVGIVGGVAALLATAIWWQELYDLPTSIRHGLFMSLTIITTTGYGTVDFLQWGEFAKGLLLAAMFIGGCAGSTGGGVKVIRVVLFFKILWLQVERAYRPNIVRPLRLGRQPVNEEVRTGVVLYLSLIIGIFVLGWLMLITIEPDATWRQADADLSSEKLLDSASAVISCLNNIGPGLGLFGPKSNYAAFSEAGKLLLTLLMLLGRLEVYAVMVLFFPGFWRRG